MNQESEHKGVVIEATPETDEQPVSKDNSTLLLLLSLLVVLVIGGAVALGYPYWQQMQQDLATLQQRQAEAAATQNQLQAQLAQAIALAQQHESVMARQGKLADQQVQFITQQKKSFEQQNQKIADAEHSFAKKQLALGLAIEDVRKLSGKPDSRWMVAEARFLMELASSRLTLAHDPLTAKTALLQAEQRLSATGEHQWQEVIAQLQRDISTLDGVTTIDLGSIDSQLQALKTKGHTLNLLNTTMRRPANSSPSAEPETKNPGWRTLLHDLGQGAKESIRIRRNDRPVQALMAPQQSVLIYQNLDIMLEGARLALLQRNTKLFHENLQRASQWVEKQFDTTDVASQEFLKQAQRLQQIQLVSELPDITRSLEYLTTRQAQPAP